LSTKSPLTLLGSHSKIQLILTISGALGIPAIGLSFAFGISPWSAALEKDLWRLAWPFFLPLFITIASLRWLFSTQLSRPERVFAYLVSAALIGVTLSGYGTSYEWPDQFGEWLGFVFPFVTLGFGIFALLRTRKNAMLKPFGAVLSMQVAYLANCLLCLSSFFGRWEIGAYCSLVTAIVYVTQMILVCRNDATHGGYVSDIFTTTKGSRHE
jgi:hypothetical protein